MLSNEFTALIIPPAVSSSTDVLLSNIIGESLPDSDISISKQRGKALMSLFKTMFADFHNAGNSSCDAMMMMMITMISIIILVMTLIL